MNLYAQDLDDNAPEIKADFTTLTIPEDGNLNGLTGISIEDLDKDFYNSFYTLKIK